MINDFKFFVPFEIEKAKDASGKEIMKIAGIASTADEDSDGEILDPSGFDLSYFTQNGFINWHHQMKNTPEAIIGEPTKAEIREDGLYVEGVLYPESKIAKQVYDLAKGLEKSSGNRRLGFSIEGKALERGSDDENDPMFKHVTKAKITGLAITPTPKNASTLVDIMKGNFKETETDIMPENIANGGNTYLLDITKPNGDRITVDRNYNIKVLSKATDTTNAGKLSPADVEGKLSNFEKKVEKNVEDKEKNPKFVSLNKSQVFSEILKATNDNKLTREVINTINFESMSTKAVKLEQLQKALSDIGVEVDVELLKGENTNFDQEVKEAQDKKCETKKDDSKQDDSDDLKKSISEKEKELELMKAKLAEKESKPDEEKVLDKVGKHMENMEKSLKDELSKSNQVALGEIKDLFKNFTDSINERISNLEQQPVGRKSAASAKYIEKAFGNPTDKNNEGKTQLSLSSNKQQINNILLVKSGIEKGENNEFYTNAMMEYEATGSLSKSVIADLYTNSNILITQ